MLSRNLYEIDEVVAALQLCLRTSNEQALFWLAELIVSEETEVARETLLESWLIYGVPNDLTLLSDIRTSTDFYSIGLRVFEACRDQKSILDQLNKAACQEKRPTMTPSRTNPSESTEEAKFRSSLDSACRLYKLEDAFWLLQAAQPILSSKSIWAAILLCKRGSAEVKQIIDSMRGGSILYQAAALKILCKPSSQHSSMMTPAAIDESTSWTSWIANAGRRSARLHAIPPGALHKETTRGSLVSKYTNIQDVYDPAPLLLEGCCWWRSVLTKHGIHEEDGAIVFPSDEVMEAFYDQYFPDDIPDEWSKADQLKSHGPGLLDTAPPKPAIIVRQTPVSRQEWLIGIHVPGRKKLTA
jgi:hypothetical protein